MISIGYVIGTIIAGLIALAALAVAAFGIITKPRWKDRGAGGYGWSDEYLSGFWTKWGGIIALLATAGIWIGATFPPFNMQYHRYATVSGTVQAVNSRFLGDGKSTSQNFVVRINGQDYRVDDTRGALVQVGDQLTLKCIRSWQYAATSGYVCNFVSDVPKAN